MKNKLNVCIEYFPELENIGHQYKVMIKNNESWINFFNKKSNDWNEVCSFNDFQKARNCALIYSSKIILKINDKKVESLKFIK